VDKTKAIIAGAGLVLAGAIGAPLILGEAEAEDVTLDAETTEALAEVAAEFGGTVQDHIKARALEMKAAADRSFQSRALRALLYMRANPTVGYGPQGAKWAQVRAALLAAETAMLAEEPSE
jgi:hypothetical protein